MENFEDLDKPSIEFKNLIKIVQLAPQQWIIQVKIWGSVNKPKIC